MKNVSRIFSKAAALLLIVSAMPMEANAQEARAEAVMLYNDARELAGGQQFLDAIEMYREAYEIASSDECEDCEDIVDLIEQQLPRVYLSRASNVFQEARSGRNLDAADRSIQYFEEAAAAGDEFGDNQVSSQSRHVIPQIHYFKSVIQFQQERFEDALSSLDRAIELNENYALAYYQRAIVLNNMDRPLDEVIDAFDRAIEVGQQVGDTENVNRSQRRAGAELVYRAAQLIEQENYNDALVRLEQAERYTPNNKDVHYRFAEALNFIGEHRRAIEYANRSLELEDGGVTDRAKIYFELGIAYKGLEMIDEACAAYENAAYGEFRDPALHTMEYELECPGF